MCWYDQGYHQCLELRKYMGWTLNQAFSITIWLNADVAVPIPENYFSTFPCCMLTGIHRTGEGIIQHMFSAWYADTPGTK